MPAGLHSGLRRVALAAAASALAASLGFTAAYANPTQPTVAAAPSSACGSLEIGSATSKDVQAAESCFSTAYTTCDAASISIVYHGGDAGVARTFETMRSENDGSCNVAEVVDHYKGTALASSDTYLCSSLKSAGDGITFMRCGAEGDVFVPTDLSSTLAKKLMSASIAMSPNA